MPLNNSMYGNNSKIPEGGLVDPIYDLSDPIFAQRLNFQPHRPGPGFLAECSKIQRFRGFKTLSQADMKERKRVQVPEGEFQDRKLPFGGRADAVPVAIYKGTILEKRQQSLTGKETFDVYEIYTLWEEQDPKTHTTRQKEVVIRWDEFNGRVQLYALVYMVHPNKKAESGKFLEANDLVGLSMVPHKDNPKKVATGGNWAGQGYWVPYVVALFYARRWSYEFRYLFVFIWGIDFPDTCIKPEQQGWRDNALGGPVIAAARRESDHFLNKARLLIMEPGQLGRKKSARGNVPYTITPNLTVSRPSGGRYHRPDSSQAFILTPSSTRPLHHVEHARSIPPTLNLGSHTGSSALPIESGYYDPVRGSRTHKLREHSDFDKEQPRMPHVMDKRHQLIGVQKLNDVPPHHMQRDQWGKRKRRPEEGPTRLPRKKTEQHKQLLGTEPREQQTEEKNLRDPGGKLCTNWDPEGRYARVHEVGKDWQVQEHEAATALMLLAGDETTLMLLAGDETALLPRAAITA